MNHPHPPAPDTHTVHLLTIMAHVCSEAQGAKGDGVFAFGIWGRLLPTWVSCHVQSVTVLDRTLLPPQSWGLVLIS